MALQYLTTRRPNI